MIDIQKIPRELKSYKIDRLDIQMWEFTVFLKLHFTPLKIILKE